MLTDASLCAMFLRHEYTRGLAVRSGVDRLPRRWGTPTMGYRWATSSTPPSPRGGCGTKPRRRACWGCPVNEQTEYALRQRVHDLEQRLGQASARLEAARALVLEAEQAAAVARTRVHLNREEQLRAVAVQAAAALCPRGAAPEELVRRARLVQEYIVHGPGQPVGSPLRRMAEERVIKQ